MMALLVRYGAVTFKGIDVDGSNIERLPPNCNGWTFRRSWVVAQDILEEMYCCESKAKFLFDIVLSHAGTITCIFFHNAIRCMQ